LRRLALILFSWEQEIRSIMGERRMMQGALFYGFSLERYVPDGYLLRNMDRFVDLSEVRAHLNVAWFSSERPPTDRIEGRITLADPRRIRCVVLLPTDVIPKVIAADRRGPSRAFRWR
jgi:hypothetical protein